MNLNEPSDEASVEVGLLDGVGAGGIVRGQYSGLRPLIERGDGVLLPSRSAKASMEIVIDRGAGEAARRSGVATTKGDVFHGEIITLPVGEAMAILGSGRAKIPPGADGRESPLGRFFRLHQARRQAPNALTPTQSPR
jgi:hypothetical protein